MIGKRTKYGFVANELHQQARRKAARRYFSQFKWPFVTVMFIFLGIVCLSYIYALYWGFITSLKDILNFNEDIFGFPQRIHFTNYVTAFRKLFVTIEAGAGRKRIMFPTLIVNSLVFAVAIASISMFSQVFVAYAATKYRFWFNKVLHFCVVVTIVVPPVSSLGMTLQIAHAIGLYDNFLMFCFTSIGFANASFLVWAGVFKGISSEYMDAAKIDGAGHYRIMFSIMMPLARVPIMIIWLLTFIGYWNSYYTQYTILPSMPNLALALWYFQFDVGNEIAWPPIQIAASMMVAIPCLLLYFIFQRWFVGGITSGGLKG